MRNKLMHGDNIKSIEEALSVDVSEQVDLVGKVAWYVVLNLLRNSLPATGEKQKLELIQPTTYCHYVRSIKTHMSFVCRYPDSPNIHEIPIPEIGVDFGEAS